MSSFIPRLTCPEAGNKYYNRKASGGYSDAIKGSKVIPGLDVLPNCVGYSIGRFMEIQGTGAAAKHPSPVNAEMFPQYLNGLKMGQEPKLGSIAVWAKGSASSSADGAGHVAVVEQINDDMSIITSESGWGSDIPFWTKTRKNDGNWGQPQAYHFIGFIYQPIEFDNPTLPGITFNVRNVQLGDSGEFVKPVQIILKGCGYYYGQIDGIAGNQTRAGILSYQRIRHLVVDGIFGPKCWDSFLKGGQ